MLPADVGVIHQQHVPRLKPVFAMHPDAVDDGGPQVRQKNRQRAEVLR
jgi:hypothetical protein